MVLRALALMCLIVGSASLVTSACNRIWPPVCVVVSGPAGIADSITVTDQASAAMSGPRNQEVP